MTVAWTVPNLEDLQTYMSASVVGNSVQAGAANEQDEAGNLRGTACLADAVATIRSAVARGSRVALSLTPGSVPPEAKMFAIVTAVAAMASAAAPALGMFINSKPFMDQRAEAVRWLSDVAGGMLVSDPTDPDPTFVASTWGDMYGQNTANVGGQFDMTWN